LFTIFGTEIIRYFGLTENAGHEIADMKMTDEIAWHENPGHEFAIGSHDKYRMNIYYITVQCAFL